MWLVMSPILSIISIVVIHKVNISKLIVSIVIMSYFCGKPKNTQWGVFSPQLYGKAQVSYFSGKPKNT